jgi:hypothetical protein
MAVAVAVAVDTLRQTGTCFREHDLISVQKYRADRAEVSRGIVIAFRFIPRNLTF